MGQQLAATAEQEMKKVVRVYTTRRLTVLELYLRYVPRPNDRTTSFVRRATTVENVLKLEDRQLGMGV